MWAVVGVLVYTQCIGLFTVPAKLLASSVVDRVIVVGVLYICMYVCMYELIY